MNKYFKEWNGEKFPVRVVVVDEVLFGYSPISVADYELWAAIEDDYKNENSASHSEAVDIDNEIYYYCDSGFIDNNPTDEEIVEYLKKNIFS